ncbi:hypothetical protein ABBQ32_013243 [Trebouxia sp. C0010 RCD-2024]
MSQYAGGYGSQGSRTKPRWQVSQPGGGRRASEDNIPTAQVPNLPRWGHGDAVENSEVATYQAGLAALRDPDSNLSPEHKAKLAADLGVHHEPPSAGEVAQQAAGSDPSQLAEKLKRGLQCGRELEAEVEKAKVQVDLVAKKLTAHNNGLEKFVKQVDEMAAADKTPRW